MSIISSPFNTKRNQPAPVLLFCFLNSFYHSCLVCGDSYWDLLVCVPNPSQNTPRLLKTMPQCHRGSVVFACQKLSNSHKIHLVSIAIALAIVSCLSGTQRRVHKQTYTKPPAAGREKREVCFIIFHLSSPTLCVRFCTVVSPCYSHSSSRACRVGRVESGDMKEFS